MAPNEPIPPRRACRHVRLSFVIVPLYVGRIGFRLQRQFRSNLDSTSIFDFFGWQDWTDGW